MYGSAGYGKVRYGQRLCGMGMAWRCLEWRGMVRHGLDRSGLAWYGGAWPGMARYGIFFCGKGMDRQGSAWCAAAWCGKTRRGMVRKGKVRYGMAYFSIDELPGVKIPWYGRPPIEVWRKLKQFTYARDGGLCWYCSKKTEYIKTHLHHVLELSEGGTNHPSNLKTLCQVCHKNRHPFMKTQREKMHED